MNTARKTNTPGIIEKVRLSPKTVASGEHINGTTVNARFCSRCTPCSKAVRFTDRPMNTKLKAGQMQRERERERMGGRNFNGEKFKQREERLGTRNFKQCRKIDKEKVKRNLE